MSIIKKTWELVDQFTEDPKYVTINKEKAKDLAVHVKDYLADAKEFFMGKPKWMKDVTWGYECQELYELIAYELILDSVNYNYWYGCGSIRPNGASSYEMSKLLDAAFLEAHKENESYPSEFQRNEPREIVQGALHRFKRSLIKNRYPNLENRLKHLGQLETTFMFAQGEICGWIERIMLQKIIDPEQTDDAEEILDILIRNYPSFSSDLFLKRAFLFIIEMNRRMGWFKEDIAKIPIPADYQIPKMLQAKGVLNYSDELAYKVGNQELIQSGSLMECEIRASAMKACKMVAEYADVTMADVDTYLFANRKSCDDPFHLTITTDY
jgi:hypothetical protein